MTLAPKLQFQWDLLVVDDFGRTVMTVDVKSRRNADTLYARAWWGRFGPGEFSAATLLVTTHRMFFWTPSARLSDVPIEARTLPMEAPTLPIFGGRIDPETTRVDHLSLQLVVETWLDRIADGEPARIAEPLAAHIERLVHGRGVRR